MWAHLGFVAGTSALLKQSRCWTTARPGKEWHGFTFVARQDFRSAALGATNPRLAVRCAERAIADGGCQFAAR